MTRHCPRGPRRLDRWRLGAVLALGVGALSTGCVTVYQPLTSLQRPAVIDPRLPNFEGTRLEVRCIPGDYLDPGDSQQLCRNVGALFTNQGAEVEVDVPRDEHAGELREGPHRPDLVIELKSRLLHEDSSKLMWLVSGVTFTIVPAVTEYSFAQDVTIRDATGFVLATDSLQARFIRYFGGAVWAVNKVMDVLVRSEGEKINEDTAKEDFSRDFYGQLSQLAFHARIRSVVLRDFEPRPPTRGKK